MRPIYDLIASFQNIQPRTEVRLIEEALGGSWDALNSDRCDLIIGAEGKAPSQGFGSHVLGAMVFEFAVATDHPLTKLAQPLPLSAIYDYPTVVVADSSRDLPVRSTGLLTGRSRIIVPSINNKIEAQRKGLGVGYLPRHRIAQELDAGALQVLTLEESRLPQSISVAWRSSNKGQGLRWFVGQLKAMTFNPKSGLKARAKPNL